MDVPKLIIVAEHDTCASTKQWMKLLHELSLQLENYPFAVLQIRAKTKPHLRKWAYQKLPKHPQIVINGMVENVKPQIHHFPQSEVQSKPSVSAFGMSIHSPLDPYKYDSFSPLYYQLGPIFPPLSKKGIGKGLSLLEQTVANTKTPILAVGGITAENTKMTLKAGAYGVASSGTILRSKDPIRSLDEMYRAVLNH